MFKLSCIVRDVTSIPCWPSALVKNRSCTHYLYLEIPASGNSFQDKVFCDICPYLPIPILPAVSVTRNAISDPVFSLQLIFTPGNDTAGLLV